MEIPNSQKNLKGLSEGYSKFRNPRYSAMEIPNSFDIKKQDSEFLSSKFGKCRFRDSGSGDQT
jgi:hypothetical protein